jgi:hypothetical protein
LAIRATGRPSTVAVLGEAAVIDQQRDPVPGEQLAAGGRGLVVLGGSALLDPGADPG